MTRGAGPRGSVEPLAPAGEDSVHQFNTTYQADGTLIQVKCQVSIKRKKDDKATESGVAKAMGRTHEQQKPSKDELRADNSHTRGLAKSKE
jgi:hypothetical protein